MDVALSTPIHKGGYCTEHTRPNTQAPNARERRAPLPSEEALGHPTCQIRHARRHQIAQNCIKLHQMAPEGPKWQQMVPKTQTKNHPGHCLNRTANPYTGRLLRHASWWTWNHHTPNNTHHWKCLLAPAHWASVSWSQDWGQPPLWGGAH